jgi:DNA-binding Lrp family transcriptional regulator
VAAIPEVLQAERLFGEPDYLLRIVTSDLAAYQRLHDDRLSVLPSVQRMTSTLVMKRIAHDRPLPAWAGAARRKPSRQAGRPEWAPAVTPGPRAGPRW